MGDDNARGRAAARERSCGRAGCGGGLSREGGAEQVVRVRCGQCGAVQDVAGADVVIRAVAQGAGRPGAGPTWVARLARRLPALRRWARVCHVRWAAGRGVRSATRCRQTAGLTEMSQKADTRRGGLSLAQHQHLDSTLIAGRFGRSTTSKAQRLAPSANQEPCETLTSLEAGAHVHTRPATRDHASPQPRRIFGQMCSD